MALQCDICLVDFNLDNQRPKSLPCGHSICKECVLNPALGKKCPTCRKAFRVDARNLPDNIALIRMMEEQAGAPPHKKSRSEDAKVQQLQRAIDAGKQVLQLTPERLPLAQDELKLLHDFFVFNQRKLETAMEKLERGEATAPDTPTLQLLAEDSHRLSLASKCSVVAEAQDGSTWRASGVSSDEHGHILSLLLLVLRASEELHEVDAVVGPPNIAILQIDNKFDITSKGQLKVDDILRDVRRWKHVRTILNLHGSGSEKLLPVVAPYLEELEITAEVGPNFMKHVEKLTRLKSLIVESDARFVGFPELPASLEQISIRCPSNGQLYRILCLPRLRSLKVGLYSSVGGRSRAYAVPFTPSKSRCLLWLGVVSRFEDKKTMLALISASASSVQELHVYSAIAPQDCSCLCCTAFHFPRLGQDLAGCGLKALRRLVLDRPHADCERVDACLMQRQAVREHLPSSVAVLCNRCDKSVF